jgi:hypothetical protein
MFNRHFFKTLIIFSSMIAIGLLGVFLVNSLGSSEEVEILEDAEVAR